MSPFDLTDKVVAITGASSGFGSHFAQVLANAGAKVVLGARREEKLERGHAGENGRNEKETGKLAKKDEGENAATEIRLSIFDVDFEDRSLAPFTSEVNRPKVSNFDLRRYHLTLIVRSQTLRFTLGYGMVLRTTTVSVETAEILPPKNRATESFYRRLCSEIAFINRITL